MKPGLDNTGDDIQAGSDPILVRKIQHFFGSFRLQTLLTVSFIIILILAMGITGLIAFFNSQYAVSELASQLQIGISDRITDHLDNYLNTPHQINQLCYNSIILGEIDVDDTQEIKRHFQELSYQYPTVQAICYGNDKNGNYSIISIVGKPGIANGTDRFWAISPIPSLNNSYEEYLINQTGKIVERTLSYPHYDPRTRPWYQAAVRAGGPSWTPVIMWLEVGAVSVDAIRPVYTREGTLSGVLDTSLTLSGIGDFLQNLQISKNGQAFITDRSGLLIASSTIKEPYTRTNNELVRLSALESNDSIVREATRYLHTEGEAGLNLSRSQQYTVDAAGKRQLVQVTPYLDKYGLDWLIFVVIPETDFMDKINASNKLTAILIIFAVFITIILCVLLARWITHPVLSMNRSAKALARGDWESFTSLDRQDELGELSHSFKYMADQLQFSFSELKRSEKRYMCLFQSSADAILLFDGFSLLHINRAAEEMFTVSGKEVAGEDIRKLFGNIGEGIGRMIEFSLSSSDTQYQEQTFSHIDNGTEHFINIRLTHVPVDGKPLHLVHIRDITDQRRAIMVFAEQEALNESYSRIQKILELLPDPTFVIDNQGRVIFWNRSIERLTGMRSADIIGKGDLAYSIAFYESKRPLLIDIALHPEISSPDLYVKTESDGDVLKTSFWLEISGENRFFSAIAARLYDHEGEIIGSIESIRDISSTKIAEDALLITNKKLALLSSITRHDIMNKIMIVKSCLYLLKDQKPDISQNDFIATIERSIHDIEQFIGFTRIYQDLGASLPAWQDVGTAFNRATAGIDTGIVVVCNKIDDISILVDPLFEKVCYNLIENAIRHGGKLTRIDITACETGEGLKITVADDGTGIPDDLKEMIFLRGYGKNTGFGLFLTREILSISNITIFERGQEGIGCRFEIEVPKEMYKRDSGTF